METLFLGSYLTGQFDGIGSYLAEASGVTVCAPPTVSSGLSSISWLEYWHEGKVANLRCFDPHSVGFVFQKYLGRALSYYTLFKMGILCLETSGLLLDAAADLIPENSPSRTKIRQSIKQTGSFLLKSSKKLDVVVDDIITKLAQKTAAVTLKVSGYLLEKTVEVSCRILKVPGQALRWLGNHLD